MEPERQIEKLLRAFAKKRREQAGEPPMEMHPSARRQLHAEISRRSRGTDHTFFAGFFARLRPRMAFAVCAAAVVCAGVWVVWPLLNQQNKQQTLASAQLAKEMPERRKTPALEAAPSPAVQAPVPQFDDKDVAFKNEKSVTAAAPEPAQPAPASAPESNLKPAESGVDNIQGTAGGVVSVMPPPSDRISTDARKSDQPAVFTGRPQAGGGYAAAPPAASVLPAQTNAVTLAMAPGGTAHALTGTRKEIPAQNVPMARNGIAAFSDGSALDEAGDSIAATSQRFNRVDASVAGQRAAGKFLKTAPQPAVLTSFRLEQNGNLLRVVDDDGSVYTGALQVLKNPIAPPLGISPAVAAAETRAKRAPSNYSFRVAGTNRNLNQNVVFSGTLIPLTNALLPGSNVAFGGGAGAGGNRSMPGQPLLLNARISGQVIIGNQRGIPVNATPVP
jgi:hypothetical protein